MTPTVRELAVTPGAVLPPLPLAGSGQDCVDEAVPPDPVVPLDPVVVDEVVDLLLEPHAAATMARQAKPARAKTRLLDDDKVKFSRVRTRGGLAPVGQRPKE
jgi:hypothetical protein